jgi:hypothetical protein
MPKAKKAKTATTTSSSMKLPDLNGLTAVAIVAGVAGATYALVEAVKGAQKNMSDLGAFTAEKLFGTKEEKELLVKLKMTLQLQTVQAGWQRCFMRDCSLIQ